MAGDTETNRLHKLGERVAKVEWRTEAIDERLAQGAEAFSDLRNSMADVRSDIQQAHDRFQEAIQPKPMAVWKIAGLVLTVVVLVSSWIWQAAKYPNREEFNASKQESQLSQEKLSDEIDSVKLKQAEIRTDQMLIKDSVQRQEKAQEKIDYKLDKLLEAPRSR